MRHGMRATSSSLFYGDREIDKEWSSTKGMATMSPNLSSSFTLKVGVSKFKRLFSMSSFSSCYVLAYLETIYSDTQYLYNVNRRLLITSFFVS